jgi:hypothetical protein
VKTVWCEAEKEKDWEKLQNLRDPYHNIRRTNIHAVGVPEAEEVGRYRNKLKEIMANF